MEEKKADEFFTRPPELTGWQAFQQFLWNPKSKELLGRTAKSWFQITAFYIVLYAFLAGFFAAMLMIFYQTLDVDQPRWQLESSRIGNSPGMGYRPKHPSPDTLTIDFNKDDPESYSKYLENLKDFLKSYEMKNDNLATCDYGFDSTEGKLCRFPISEHIPTECSNENSYGFANGNPCIFLKLNKIFGWTPESYTTDELLNLPDMDDSLKNRIGNITDQKKREGNVWVSCEGEGEKDKDSLKGTILNYGVEENFGFPKYYYPYMNKAGYQAPFVVLQLVNLPKETPVRLICRLWAKNINHDRQRRLGMTLLEIHSK